MIKEYPKKLTEKVVGKNVIIVFPSKAAEKNTKGLKIEKFDTVVRIGNGFKTKGIEDKIGNRTDILFHSLRGQVKWQGIEALDLNELEERNIEFVIYKNIRKNQNRYNRIKKRLKNKNIRVLPSLFRSYKAYNKNNLLQGMDAIFTILHLEPKHLFIYGKDFYDSGYQKNYRTKWIESKKCKRNASRGHPLSRMKRILAINLIKFNNVSIDTITSQSLLNHNFGKEVRQKIKNKTNYKF